MLYVFFPHQMSPLHWASERDHMNTVKFLVENGANLHSKDGEGVSNVTVLLTVVITLYEDLCSRSLLSLHQFTPLHRAAIRGYTDAVQYLIDKGGGINIKNVNGVRE